MDKKSGVYYELTDNSLRVGGSSPFGGIVLMYTTKGEVGKLNRVSIRDYRDILGYDIKFNPNYAGLDRMLSTVAFLEVLRLNANPLTAYKTWNFDNTAIPSHPQGYENYLAIEDDMGDNTIWVACKSPGTWGNDRYVAFTKTESDEEFFLHYYTLVDGESRLIKSHLFSIIEDSNLYYKKLDFGDIHFGFNGNFGDVDPDFFIDSVSILPTDDFYRMYAGDNGSQLNYADDISQIFPAIDNSSANIVVFNGLFETPIADRAIIQGIIEYCAKQDRSVLIDAPLLKNPDTDALVASDDLYEWSQSLYSASSGSYAQIAAIPDRVVASGEEVLIQPSVYLFQIYARMFADYGHLNFPPAGSTYGQVSVNQLLDNDFHYHGDDLKRNRINYLTPTSRGVCMWEYRTLYNNPNSDLSYANVPYILRDLKGRLMEFMDNFTFKYSTPMDLLVIQSGLTSILSSFVNNYFLVNYTLNVPSFAEAQAAGRSLTIDIAVSVINAADVITLRVNLMNAADLRAA